VKILQILHNHKIGGAEQHLIQLCIGLRDAGHEIEVAAAKKSWVAEQLRIQNFAVHDFDFKSHIDFISLIKLIKLLQKSKFDIVHTHLVRAALFGRGATYVTKTPLVSTVHDLTTWKHYPRVRNIIAVSDAVKRHLMTRKYKKSKTDVVFPGARDFSLGIETGKVRQELRRQLGIEENDAALFLVGRVAQVKGHDIALTAMEIVRAKYGTSVKMFFVGEITEWGRLLQNRSDAINAHWLGRRNDIPQLLSAADICVQPSRSEGLPLSLMEAASASKPIVATCVGGIPEVIEDQVSGLLIPSEDSSALADAIIFLLENPHRAKEFGMESRRNYERKFSLNSTIQNTLKVYKKCAGLRPL
jgi:glycosyltransferase involved in cell wall biosynthesis